ncbi:hypothetical protein CEUSTIGMA_g13703.t1 [Chlamydomonas eustigma]|uniref:Uncharacterized protein n=1 Tax=Chlamydomonas eustigma TaxID=1157962 RepID=A0A250XT68_9CHLO|nr:hypothetical protein CEUSTIGMA_g13703.t1 [Chlamydomonas eustigma]|eukprot:GAX86291.1 hypothetical protein CEUSTIGMA_g13703.t1 [Chlamydomonas eustigma]
MLGLSALCFVSAGGRDHFWWMTGDFGACWMPHHLMETGIKIVHFGMSGANLNWRQGYKGESPHPEYACYLPERDIMATPVIPTLFPNSGKSMELFKKIKNKHGKDGLLRPILFFFAGGIRDNDPSYSGSSGSARQVLVAALKGHNYSDVLVATGAIMGTMFGSPSRNSFRIQSFQFV